ncbi:hypothetical protein [Hyalangium versicolor]|uniref:hypothetical protein n=1 Tax=Hyalangium versicolor TaxID=2861190 RepID=UPI001CCE2A04|nr:hypothetical protein [Hyalangium versicolor]
MKVTTPAQTTVTAAAKPATPSIVAGGCFPKPPVPTLPTLPNLPDIFSPDRKTRATQGNQLHEIADGVRSGSITAQESETLLKEQQAIADAQKQAMSDGKLSLAEKLKLGLMQARADRNIQQASHNGSRDFFAPLNANAQRQAGQIDQLATGRTNGNITNSEASKLLGQQVEIADARGDADSKPEAAQLQSQLSKADGDIARHSKPGTQLDVLPFPHPLPLPLPKPLPTLPKPLPTLPRPLPHPLPSKPVFEALPFLKGSTTNV